MTKARKGDAEVDSPSTATIVEGDLTPRFFHRRLMQQAEALRARTEGQMVALRTEALLRQTENTQLRDELQVLKHREVKAQRTLPAPAIDQGRADVERELRKQVATLTESERALRAERHSTAASVERRLAEQAAAFRVQIADKNQTAALLFLRQAENTQLRAEIQVLKHKEAKAQRPLPATDQGRADVERELRKQVAALTESEARARATAEMFEGKLRRLQVAYANLTAEIDSLKGQGP